MAERRMFAKSIIESDQFMDMPAEAQMLYIHLNMAADDDGFCDNPRAIMRLCGAGNDVMKLLIAKKFVLTFEKNDGFIVVVKHWRMNNYIRKDNYRETKYKELMRDLYYDENRSYSTNPDDGHKPCLPEAVTSPSQDRIRTVDESYTDCIRTVDEPLTQDRIGKDSIELGKDRKGKERKEESEGKTVSVDLSDPEVRISRIKHWKKRIDFMREMGQDPGGMYDLAKIEGITAADIDYFKEEQSNG